MFQSGLVCLLIVLQTGALGCLRRHARFAESSALCGKVVARLEKLEGWMKEFEWLAPSLKSRKQPGAGRSMLACNQFSVTSILESS